MAGWPSTHALSLMLCESCQKVEATVHLTRIMGERMETSNFCPACFAKDQRTLLPFSGSAKGLGSEATALGFSRDFQNKLLQHLLKEQPEIFASSSEKESFRERFHAIKTRLAVEIARELAAQGVAANDYDVTMISGLLMARPLMRNALRLRPLPTQAYRGLTPVEFRVLEFLEQCIRAAGGARPGVQVRAEQILAVAAEVARKLYGATAREELMMMGLTSSAVLGQQVYAFIKKGLLGKTDTDDLEDFHVRSSFDVFMEGV